MVYRRDIDNREIVNDLAEDIMYMANTSDLSEFDLLSQVLYHGDDLANAVWRDFVELCDELDVESVFLARFAEESFTWIDALDMLDVIEDVYGSGNTSHWGIGNMLMQDSTDADDEQETDSE